MGLLDINPFRLTSSKELDRLRARRDPARDAAKFIRDTILAWRLNGGDYHFWLADEPTQIRLALAALASSMGQLAEALYLAGKQLKGYNVLPEDIADFVQSLFAHACQVIDNARANSPEHIELEFHETTRQEDLYPERHLPWWPVYGSRAQLAEETWQHQSAGTASPQFIRGLIAAGHLLYLQVLADVDGINQIAGRRPPFILSAVPGLIREHQVDDERHGLAPALEVLTQARDIMGDEGWRSDQDEATAYQLAHQGVTDVFLAAMYLVAPPMMGEDFRRHKLEESGHDLRAEYT